MIAPSPNAAIAPYVAVGRGDAHAGREAHDPPSASVRRMTSRLIGPTAAAIVKPRMMPRAEQLGIHGMSSRWSRSCLVRLMSYLVRQMSPVSVTRRRIGWSFAPA